MPDIFDCFVRRNERVSVLIVVYADSEVAHTLALLLRQALPVALKAVEIAVVDINPQHV